MILIKDDKNLGQITALVTEIIDIFKSKNVHPSIAFYSLESSLVYVLFNQFSQEERWQLMCHFSEMVIEAEGIHTSKLEERAK